jgi:hypothetical protein
VRVIESGQLDRHIFFVVLLLFQGLH